MKNSKLHLIGTFDNYLTDDISNPKSELQDLLNTPDKWTYDIVIIQSELGNGSTHLLHAALSEIEKQERHATFAYAYELPQNKVYSTTMGGFVQIEELQVSPEFFLVDDCQFFECTPNYYPYFTNLLKSSIEQGVKIILTTQIGSLKRLINDFPNHYFITSEFPTTYTLYYIISRLFRSHPEYCQDYLVTEEIQERAVISFANQSYHSVRLLESIVLTFLANLCLGKIQLHEDNIEILIENYVNTFIAKYG